MTMDAVWLKIDGERVRADLQEVLEKLDSDREEIILDFSSVHRIDAGALGDMDELAAEAHDKSVRVVLRGVHADVYKVLKLVKLAARFSFLS
jgi:anti-anti-sigma regulatory factor